MTDPQVKYVVEDDGTLESYEVPSPESSCPKPNWGEDTFYTAQLKKKRAWTAGPITAGELRPGGEDVVKRALSLRILEIPVGNFVKEATKGDLPKVNGVKEVLLSNIDDEDKHDIALNHAAAVIDCSKYEREAEVIKKAWLDLDRHPILKTVVIERSVFFVLLPIFRYLGSVGLRKQAAEISRDEVIHTSVGSKICTDLNLQGDKQLNALRRATVAWVVDSLHGQSDDKFLSKDFWQNNSKNLYYTGQAPDLVETRASRMPAFFETNAIDLPQYI